MTEWRDLLLRVDDSPLFQGPWKFLADGCRCNRDTARLLADAGFTVDAREARWRAMPPIVRPLIAGRATIY